MPNDAVISDYKSGSKASVLNSAGAIASPVVYGIYDRATRNVLQQFPSAAAADTGLMELLAHRVGNRDLCVVTIPA